jgi:hypothetical protein
MELDGSLFFDEMLALAGVSSTVPTYGTRGPSEHIPSHHNKREDSEDGDGIVELFPPKTPYDLASLLQEIDSCDWEQLRRDCLFYYLLKFWAPHRGVYLGLIGEPQGDSFESEDRAAKFAGARMIPEGFAILADAYFYLDIGDCGVSTAPSFL